MPKHKHDPLLLAAIGSRLKALRVERGLSQAQLADALGIETVTMSRYETGSRGPSVTLLNMAARTLGVSLGELLAVDSALPEPSESAEIAMASALMALLDSRDRRLAIGALEGIARAARARSGATAADQG